MLSLEDVLSSDFSLWPRPWQATQEGLATAASQSCSQLTEKKIAALMSSDQPDKHWLVSPINRAGSVGYTGPHLLPVAPDLITKSSLKVLPGLRRVERAGAALRHWPQRTDM